MKKEKWLTYVFCMFPLLDFFTGMSTWEHFPSIGVILRGIFLLGIILYLIKIGKEKKNIWLFLAMIFLFSTFYILLQLQNDRAIFTEVSHIMKVFYFPILIVFLKEYQQEKITDETLTKILFFYLLLYLLPYPFGLGHNMNEVYINKDLYLSYFNMGNELANVMILLIPISLSYLLKENKRKEFISLIFLILAMLLLLGTKAMYLSIGILLLFFILTEKRIQVFLKQNITKIICIIIVMLGLVIVWLPRSDFYQNIKTTLEFYEIHSIQDALSLENIDHLVFSNRLSSLQNIAQIYHQENIFTKLFGLGRTKILQQKDIEMDVFDIYYSIGLLGFIVYIYCFLFSIQKNKYHLLTKFLCCFMILLSTITGHVLLSPMVSTYLAVLLSRNQNELSSNLISKHK